MITGRSDRTQCRVSAAQPFVNPLVFQAFSELQECKSLSSRLSGVIATARMPEKLYYLPFPILEALGSESKAARRRADMVYFETGKGGAVFSASSVGWNGALSHNGDQNAASRLTANVLRSFQRVLHPAVPDRDPRF
jgi:hypothetical protein